MMIFAHTLEKVLNGEKTQTRRLVKPGDSWDAGNGRVMRRGQRIAYEIGKSYAVQPNRGKKSIARIRITSLRRETVASISEADAVAEGFASRADFIDAWHRIHGQNADLNAEVWVLEFELHEA